MAKRAEVDVLKEVVYDESRLKKNWVLCLQWCRYNYDDGTSEEGYRFIWRRPNGNLQPAMGQARIPNLFMAEALMSKARAEGWGNYSSSLTKDDNK
ncbi:hypothetical protein ACWV26_06705 [Rummeliibacillus sp. JY-2-4R]